MRELAERLGAALPRLDTLLGPGRGAERRLLLRYGGLNLNKRSKATRTTRILEPLVRFVAAGPAPGILHRWSRFLAAARDCSGFKDHGGFPVLLTGKWTKQGDNRADCPGLEELIDLLGDLERRTGETGLEHLLTTYTIHRIHDEMERHREAKGGHRLRRPPGPSGPGPRR